jgi:hypothetical protein
MTQELKINRAPCTSCPYRKDVPSGIWVKEEYDKILPYDGEMWVQPRGVFLCHQNDGSLCRGWLDCHGDNLLAVRLLCSRGDATSAAMIKALDEGPAVAVFNSAADASKHGRKAIRKPGKRAQVLMDSITRKRGKLCIHADKSCRCHGYQKDPNDASLCTCGCPLDLHVVEKVEAK